MGMYHKPPEIGIYFLFTYPLQSRHIEEEMSTIQMSDDLRMKNYLIQEEQRKDLKLRDMEGEHKAEIEKAATFQSDRLNQIRNAYETRFSQESEQLSEKLSKIREKKEESVSQEKQAAEEELTKLKTAHQKRLEEYKKNSEAQVESMKKEFQTVRENIHEQSRNAARAEKEKS